VLLIKYCSVEEIKEDEMGGTCGTRVKRSEKYTGFSARNLRKEIS